VLVPQALALPVELVVALAVEVSVIAEEIALAVTVAVIVEEALVVALAVSKAVIEEEALPVEVSVALPEEVAVLSLADRMALPLDVVVTV
jgi:hypothetical protein